MVLEIHCSGFFSTFNWIAYNEIANQDDQNVNLQIEDVLTDVGQFVQTQLVNENTSQTNQYYDADEPGGNIILDLARTGDSSNNRYYAGMYENRHFVYDQVRVDDADEIKYQQRVFDNFQRVVAPGSGLVVDPASVRPNNYFITSDIFAGYQVEQAGSENDPRVQFIENVVYSEPWNLQIQPGRADSIDNIFATSGFGGASYL
jgi:hypothetical protein